MYVAEIKRVLKTGGICFLHYSNAGGEDLSSNKLSEWGMRGAMNNISMIGLVADCKILHDEVIDWGKENLDAIIIFQK
jgi:hypothetical protein